MGWYVVRSTWNGCHLLGSGSGAPVTPYFSKILENGFMEKKGGRPIEGFEPFMLMEAYPGLQSSDFNCIKAYGGFYTVENDQVVFILYKSISMKRSTAEHSIVSYGMNRLLQNIADRLGRPWPHTEMEVDDILMLSS